MKFAKVNGRFAQPEYKRFLLTNFELSLAVSLRHE
jgi:hypothetical protein